MFTAVLISFEEKDEVDEPTGVEISNAVYEYLDEHPEEKELLIRFADDALSLIIYYDSDFFDAKSVLLKVAEAGLEGELYDYIREEYWDVLKSAYLERIALARRYIKEMTE